MFVITCECVCGKERGRNEIFSKQGFVSNHFSPPCTFLSISTSFFFGSPDHLWSTSETHTKTLKNLCCMHIVQCFSHLALNMQTVNDLFLIVKQNCPSWIAERGFLTDGLLIAFVLRCSKDLLLSLSLLMSQHDMDHQAVT